MPLKGKAKTDYQRQYMRRKRAGLTTMTNPDGTCQTCGRYGVVDKHYKDRNHDNNGGNNMMGLCPNCHADIHRRSNKGLTGSNQPKAPLYNPSKHRPRDRVRIGGKDIVIPELDADGQVIPEY